MHIQTFSHVFGLTGLRVGYAIAPPALIDRMRGKRIARPINVFGRAGALAALRDADSQVKRCAPVVQEGRATSTASSTRWACATSPRRASTCSSTPGAAEPACGLRSSASESSTRYGREWGMEGWLRVCPGQPEENRRFIASLRTVLSQPDPGNPPQFPVPLGPLLPPGPEGRALAAGLERRQRHDLAMERLAGPVKRPYRAIRAE